MANPLQASAKTICSINAIRHKGCFKYGSEDHFVKDSLLSQPNNSTQTGHYTDYKGAQNGNSSFDKVMEPLSRLFTDLWNNSSYLHHQDMVPMGEHQLIMAGPGMVSGRWVPTMVLGGSAMTTTPKGKVHNRTTIQIATIKHPLGTMATNEAIGLVIEATSQEGITPGSMKLGLVVNVTGSECSVMSDLKEHLEGVAPVTASPKN